MAFNPTENRLGIQPIATTVAISTLYQPGQSTQFNPQHTLGEIVRAIDPTFGGGEFIYLKGVASTIVGSVVSYDPVNGTTTLGSTTAQNQDIPLAVAMAACVSGYYGWYQIAGCAVIKKGAVTVTPSVPLYLSAVTAGRATSLASGGRQIMNCRSVNAATVASATSTITAVLQRPFSQGAIT
jgi:hypothetical protein